MEEVKRALERVAERKVGKRPHGDRVTVYARGGRFIGEGRMLKDGAIVFERSKLSKLDWLLIRQAVEEKAERIGLNAEALLSRIDYQIAAVGSKQ